jgi:hypothetical protein
MAIDRLRSPYNNLLVVTGDVGPSAFASIQLGGFAPYTFIGDGAANTIVGVTYRVHRFEYVPGANNSITFSQGGNIDILMAAGGGPGGGNYSSSAYSGGGGGAGGLVLMYSYGVTATTYSLSVGKGGYSTTNPALGNYYYINPATNASNSTFGALTAIRGGAGAPGYGANTPETGGSGGGAASGPSTSGAYQGAIGTTGQGFYGGSTATIGRDQPPYCGGGGGSCLESGGTPTVAYGGTAHKGGDGISLKFDGTIRGYCAGGGGGTYSTSYPVAPGGANGGGTGSVLANGGKGTSFGSGGGGAGGPNSNAHGGGGMDGVIIIRYALG